MDFRLSGVGADLETPCVVLIQGETIDATQAAFEMLDQNPSCEEVEIFAGVKFLRGVRRSRQRLFA